MKKAALATSIYLLSCLMAAHSQVSKPETPVKDALTGEIVKILNRKIFNGFAVSIVDDQGVVYQNGFGFSDVATNTKYTENTIQPIASVSKIFVGIALLKAQELGKLNLDDPIERYLPFVVVNPGFPQEKITIRHLATHTSSIIDNEYYLSKNYFLKPHQDLKGVRLDFDNEQIFNPPDAAISMQAFLKEVVAKDGKWNKNSFTDKKPGDLYAYSNVGTALAGLIIEQATGKSFADFTKEYILDPLGMNASYWNIKDTPLSGDYATLYASPNTALPCYETITYPDGGLITSMNNLSQFLTELIKGYNGKGTLLSKESYKEYFRPQLSAFNFTERNERNPYSESYNSGIFIGFGYTGYIGHTGGDPGVMAILFFDPKTNLGRMMIFNTSFSDKAGNDTFYDLWNLLEKYQYALQK